MSLPFFNRQVSIFLSVLAVVFYTAPAWADGMPPLKNGDIVFHTSSSNQSLAVMLATTSLYSHMGIIKIGNDKKAYVIEASNVVKATKLQSWIDRGVLKRVTVMRFKKPDKKRIEQALAWAQAQKRKPYDIYFLPANDAFYCSELVADAYEQAGIELGHVEKLADLDADIGAVQKLIKSRSAHHPLCKKSALVGDACIDKIMNQTLITPISIADDPQLETIYSNYGPL